MRYVDETKLIQAWLDQEFPSIRNCTELPASLLAVLPVIQVTRFAGAETAPTLDAPSVDIEVYAADWESAKDIAEQVRGSLTFDLPGFTALAATVARVTTLTGPARRPTSDPNLRRAGASYRVIIHSH